MTENEMRVCRRCLLFESGRQDILKDIKEHIDKIPGEKKTQDEAYAHRLAVCGECDCLESGTCLKCGCYPEFRAAFAANKCPCGKW